MAIPPSQTLVYKRVGDLDIELELFLPSNPHNAPILLWFHGGGLLQGQRKSVAPHMLRGVEKYGYALASADYRLAPQTRAPAILSDALSAITFLRTSSHPSLQSLNRTALTVSGSSAGGYLALLVALHHKVTPTSPPLAAVLAIYPITDPCGMFFRTLHSLPPLLNADGTLSLDPQPVKDEEVKEYLDAKGPVVAGSPRGGLRDNMYRHMLQSGSLAGLLGVEDVDIEMRIGRAIVARGPIGEGTRKESELPPIYIVHGDADRFVGVEQADEVVGVLRDFLVDGHDSSKRVEYERLVGKDHMFDKDESVEMEGMYRFMGRWVELRGGGPK